MADRSPFGDIGPVLSVWRHQTSASPRRHFRRSFSHQGIAERIAQIMISRHGANAAWEATKHLNNVIDRGDLAARDLWAGVVHIIHERQDRVDAKALITADDKPLMPSRLAVLAK